MPKPQKLSKTVVASLSRGDATAGDLPRRRVAEAGTWTSSGEDGAGGPTRLEHGRRGRRRRYFEGSADDGLEPDLEARDLWIAAGFSPEKVLPGSKADNFWEMGDAGPCGPCTELHYDALGGRGDVGALVNMDDPTVLYPRGDRDPRGRARRRRTPRRSSRSGTSSSSSSIATAERARSRRCPRSTSTRV